MKNILKDQMYNLNFINIVWLSVFSNDLNKTYS
jgi:hypothetical protein